MHVKTFWYFFKSPLNGFGMSLSPPRSLILSAASPYVFSRSSANIFLFPKSSIRFAQNNSKKFYTNCIKIVFRSKKSMKDKKSLPSPARQNSLDDMTVILGHMQEIWTVEMWIDLRRNCIRFFSSKKEIQISFTYLRRIDCMMQNYAEAWNYCTSECIRLYCHGKIQEIFTWMQYKQRWANCWKQ